MFMVFCMFIFITKIKVTFLWIAHSHFSYFKISDFFLWKIKSSFTYFEQTRPWRSTVTLMLMFCLVWDYSNSKDQTIKIEILTDNLKKNQIKILSWLNPGKGTPLLGLVKSVLANVKLTKLGTSNKALLCFRSYLTNTVHTYWNNAFRTDNINPWRTTRLNFRSHSLRL